MTATETIVCSTGLVALGVWRCAPDDARFPGGRVLAHLVVFPRTAVRIERDTTAPVVADPTVAVLYEPHSEYRRRLVDRRGDFCDFFALEADLVEQLSAMAGSDAALSFARGASPVPADVYLAQRRLLERALDGEVDPLEVDETVLVLASRVVARPEPPPPVPARPATRSMHEGLVADTVEYVAVNHTRPLRLVEIARAVGSSPYHLARVFRGHTGTTVHQRVTGLRLRRSLDLLRSDGADLATLAIELGFSSHSHFTRAFTSEFGMTPSAFRDTGRKTRTIVQAAGQ